MVSNSTLVKVGSKLKYKLIKDGYKTISDTVDVTSSTSKDLTLTAPSEIYTPNLNYSVNDNGNHPPILVMGSSVTTPSQDSIPAGSYILASKRDVPYIVLNDTKDNFYRVGNVDVDSNGIYHYTGSNSGFLKLLNDFGTVNNLTAIFNVSNITNLNTVNCIFSLAENNSNSGLRYHSKLRFFSNDNEYLDGTGLFSSDKSYWVGLVFDNSDLSLKVYYMEDNSIYSLSNLPSFSSSEWTLSIDGQLTSNVFSNSSCFIAGNKSYVLTGDMNLNKTKISVNGSDYWIPVVNPNSKRINVNGYLYMLNGINKSPFTDSIFIEPNPGYFNKVGNVADNWEWCFKIEKFIHSDSTQTIFCEPIAWPTDLYIDTEDKIGLLIKKGNGYELTLQSTTTLIENNSYFIKIKFTGSNYEMYLSADGVTYNLEAEYASTAKLETASGNIYNIGRHNQNNYYDPCVSELNLEQSYIKVDGNLWWSLYYTYTGKQFSYDNESSSTRITIFSDYMVDFNEATQQGLWYSQSPGVTVTSYEFVSKFYLRSLNGGRLIGNYNSNIRSLQVEMDPSKQFWIGHPLSNGSWAPISSKSFLETYKWYYVKVVYENNVVSAYYKTENDEDWIKMGDIEANSCRWDEGFYIGWDVGTSGSYPFNGKVDLKESYIKINGSYWWVPVQNNGLKCNGILDPNYVDTSSSATVKLYSVDSKDLVLGSNRASITTPNKYIEYCGDVTIPAHTAYHEYNGAYWIPKS